MSDEADPLTLLTRIFEGRFDFKPSAEVEITLGVLKEQGLVIKRGSRFCCSTEAARIVKAARQKG